MPPFSEDRDPGRDLRDANAAAEGIEEITDPEAAPATPRGRGAPWPHL